RSFDQSRDKADSADQGKVLLLMSDEEVSRDILKENFDLVLDRSEQVSLKDNARLPFDAQADAKVGEYVLIYEFRDKGGALIAGGPLSFIVPEALKVDFSRFVLTDHSVTAKIELAHIPGWKADSSIEAALAPANDSAKTLAQQVWPAKGLG